MKRRVLLSGLFCAALAVPLAAPAAAWPEKPVRVVVPFAAGGGVDILTRTLAEHLQKRLGQPVVVENRPGAGGNIGVADVAKSAPDGYSFVMATTGTHTINPGLYRKLPFDAQADFAPVTFVASVPNLLVVPSALPVHDVRELVALARNKPHALSFGSFGNGTSNHLSGELFKSIERLDIVHVPYKSAPMAVKDLISGQIEMAFVNTPLALPHVNAGSLRALAVTGAKRSAAVPQFPTMEEAGVPGFVVESWYGLMAPAGTPEPIIRRMREEMLAVLARPDVKAFFATQGADVLTSTPQEFADTIRTEQTRWAKVIEAAGARVD